VAELNCAGYQSSRP